MAGPLADASRRLAKDKFKQWLEGQTSNAAVVVFVLDQFELAYDLIVQSIERGGVPTKADVVRYFGSKAVSLSGLSADNRVACVASIVTFGLTSSTAPAAGAGGPAAWAWYIGALMLDGLDIGGNCYLAYQDVSLEGRLADFERQIAARRMKGHAAARVGIDGNASIGSALDAMLNWQQRNRNSCELPPAQAMP